MRHSLVFAFCAAAAVALDASAQVTSADIAETKATQSIGTSFYGVALGERGAEVYERLGKPTLSLTTNHGPTWAYSIQHGNAWLVVLLEHGLVASINALPQADRQPSLTDQFGVRVGDSTERLQSIRGVPSGFAEPNIYYYSGTSSDPNWMYGVWQNAILSIGITTGETNIPALVIDWRQDGSRPDRAIVIHVTPGKPISAQELAHMDKDLCERPGSWNVLERRQLVVSGEKLDAVKAVCSTSETYMTFYFRTD